MRSAEHTMDYLKWILAGVAAFFHNVPELTWFLLILMAIDTVFGVWVAAKQQHISPTAMWDGVTKKIGSLLIICLGAAINHFVGIKGIDFVLVFTGFYIGPELFSILRNAAIVGVPVPPQVTSVMRYFRDKDAANANSVIPKDSR